MHIPAAHLGEDNSVTLIDGHAVSASPEKQHTHGPVSKQEGK
jgi:hypothetical protein